MQGRVDGASRWLGALVVFWTFLLGCTPLRDFDVWWHLRTGQLILERGSVPYVDWFTYTSAERPWIDLHWGFQVLIAWLYSLGGVDAILLAKAAVSALAVAVAWWGSGRGLPAWLKAGVWIVAVVAIAGRILERPDVLSLLALAGWMSILHASAERPRLLWLLPVIQLAWANVHALSILGLLVGSLFVLDHLAHRLSPGILGSSPPAAPLGWRPACGLGALVVLASLATPYGVRGLLFPIELFQKISGAGAFYSQRIGEFLPPTRYVQVYGIDTVYLPAALVLLVIAAVSFVPAVSRGRFSLFRAGVFLAFTYLALRAMRNVNLFAVVAGLVTCWNLRDRIADEEAAGRPAPRAMRISRRADLAAVVVLVLLAASVGSGFWGRHLGAAWGTEFRLGLYADDYFADDAIRFAGRSGMPRRALFIPFAMASLYEFQHGPDAKVFMDARLEVSSRETYEQWEEICARIAAGDASFEELVRDADGQVPVVVIDPHFEPRILAGMLAMDGWSLVYADERAAVFVPDAVAAAGRFPAIDPRRLRWHGRLPGPAAGG